MKWLIENSGDLRFAGSVYSLDAAYALLNPEAARIAAELAAEALRQAETAEMETGGMETGDATTCLAEAPALEIQAGETLVMEASGSDETTWATTAWAGTATEPAATETARGLAARHDRALLPNALTLQDVRPVRSPETAHDLAARHDRALLPNALTPRDVRPVRSTETATGLRDESSAPELKLAAAPEEREQFDAIVIDKGLGLTDVMELLHKLTASSPSTPAVVWGSAISEPEALRLLQAGARGILRRTSESGTLLTCLRAVTSGGTWMEDGIFGSTEKLYNRRRSELTHRESEVVGLVEKGLRNRDIARMLGIQTGTVKIHLKHIFEKTGVRGRYGLALTGLQNKGSITLSPPPQFTA
jgi:DNA-binding NarL/FixJ family response regulator